jgi:hypothetical protein
MQRIKNHPEQRACRDPDTAWVEKTRRAENINWSGTSLGLRLPA